jgi:hypothetical protein
MGKYRTMRMHATRAPGHSETSHKLSARVARARDPRRSPALRATEVLNEGSTGLGISISVAEVVAIVKLVPNPVLRASPRFVGQWNAHDSKSDQT